ncbi:MAG: carotenoid biosynthesis protein [Kastovskya adunca ATA6-11-RM4]|jgi:putative membrane protein|nr:carotenoid biosynthesis protein [Kastovskya adunca ATA6-11-RM4]
MQQLVKLERSFLIAHIVSMVFGLAGLLIVLPHPELIAGLSTFGQTLFQWGMAGGGVVYIIFGAIAVAIYAYRTLGLWHWLTFMLPSACISLGSELLGTSTGFPFGEYGYLSGLGYKVAGLVPFTIPLSWFYMGLVSYLIARAGLKVDLYTNTKSGWWRQTGAVILGSILLTSWDFVLDPAMSQTAYPFWHYGEVGAYFGTPFQNFAGWLATGIVFMTVAALLWKKSPIALSRQQLGFPLAVYFSNIAFGIVLTLGGTGIWIPVGLGVLLGLAPAAVLWWMAASTPMIAVSNQVETETPNGSVPMAQVGAMPK